MNNNSNNNNKYMCMEVGYNDPDKEYETLDDDTYTDNFSIPTSSTTTSLINTDQNSYCIDFNEESLSNVKKFIENSEEFLDRKDDNDIDWLSSDFDVQSDVGSLWASTIDEFEDSKIIDENHRRYNSIIMGEPLTPTNQQWSVKVKISPISLNEKKKSKKKN
ncbi:9475_t:CDS:2 [Entrophospora sp. SA101]|nr:9475_t:CDS:2 [Entrophospora sp. SA101]